MVVNLLGENKSACINKKSLKKAQEEKIDFQIFIHYIMQLPLKPCGISADKSKYKEQD